MLREGGLARYLEAYSSSRKGDIVRVLELYDNDNTGKKLAYVERIKDGTKQRCFRKRLESTSKLEIKINEVTNDNSR